MSLSPSEVFKSLSTPTWDGAPSTYRAYRRKIVAMLIKKDLAALLFHEETGLAELTTETTPKRANANIKVFAILPESISDTMFQVIEAETDDLGYDASKLWEAITTKANGTITSTSGYDFQADVESWVWPTVSAGGISLTLPEQCESAISEVSELVDRAVRLANKDFPFTVALGIHKVLKDLPRSLRHNVRQYRAFKTLPQLGQELAVDAHAMGANEPPHAAMPALLAKLPQPGLPKLR